MYFGKIRGTENGWGFDVFPNNFENYKEISSVEHMRIVEQANQKQKLITGDKDGNPILTDPPPPSEEEMNKRRLNELASYLRETDWYAIRYADNGVEIPLEIKNQRQLAREEISVLREGTV